MRLLLLALLVPATLHAQDFDFYARGPYRNAVPRPETLLGYRVGSQQTMYYQQQQVLRPDDRGGTRSSPDRSDRPLRRREGDAAPDHFVAREPGAAGSDPGRPVPAGGPPADHGAGSRRPSPSARRSPCCSPTRSTATNRRGSRPSCRPPTSCSPPMSRRRWRSSRTAWCCSIRRRTPTGTSASRRGTTRWRWAPTSPAAVEQTEPWAIWGRYNHYRFDMNRDQLAQSQPESRALGDVYHPLAAPGNGRPAQHHVAVLLPAGGRGAQPEPAARPRISGSSASGATTVAPSTAYGWQYYVRDVFDFFYPGLHRHVADDARRARHDVRDRRWA